ncbi:MAG: galactosyl transferase [Massilia sp.]|jgi:hypothetical protein|nr:galactosyl transferase [Massilia sp.]
MDAVVKFVIPVRHPENSRDWNELKRNLASTVRSISAQQAKNWRGVVVANSGSDLPTLPSCFSVVWVDFPPNSMHERDSTDRASFFDAVRLDKGSRILAGILGTPRTDYTMVVDDDDFVSNALTSFVEKNKGQNGWYVRDGYVWSEGDPFLYQYLDFSNLCGSSHIIRTDLLSLPATLNAASDTYIKNMLGSHIFIRGYLEKSGSPLAVLPFFGAVYRVGHTGSHSKSSGMLSTFFLQKNLLWNPREVVWRFLRLRWLSQKLKREFFG